MWRQGSFIKNMPKPRTEEQRAKQREYSRKWRAENPQKSAAIIARQYQSRRTELLSAKKARYDANPEKYKAYSRKYYQYNKEKCLASTAAWQDANRDKVRQAQRRWREHNKEKQQAATARWAYEHPDKVRQRTNRRRARKTGAIGFYSVDQLRARAEVYGFMCAYCRSAPAQCMDHVIPLARGGTNWPSNHRPACNACNSSKGAKLPSEWLPTKGQPNP